ncbi:MAG: hypothetical protein J0L57_01565 [Burkholderiales bacterium]|nr:hypothetical protein [Burkholderiales bacterium]
MASPSATRAAITRQADLPEVCQFLHENLGRRFSAQAWRDSLLQNWATERPNFGTHLRHDGRVVGVLCAIYSDQIIDGRPERFCNPHSWVVLEEHRHHSIGLLSQLLRQSDYHFTMFTPNPKVAQVFLGLRFRVLDDRLLFVPNLPRPAFGGVVETDSARIGGLLDGPARRDFARHAHLPWLRFAAFGRPGDMCLVVYKPSRWKKLPCATVGHISDAGAFDRHRALLHNHLLSQGFAFSRVEARFLCRTPALAIRSHRGMPKLVLSKTLSDAQVTDLYSELMALDL